MVGFEIAYWSLRFVFFFFGFFSGKRFFVQKFQPFLMVGTPWKIKPSYFKHVFLFELNLSTASIFFLILIFRSVGRREEDERGIYDLTMIHHDELDEK